MSSDRTDKRTHFQVKKEPDGSTRLIWRFILSDKLKAAIVAEVDKYERAANRPARTPNTVTLGYLREGQWETSHSPYALALIGLPTARARIQQFLEGVTPSVKKSGHNKPPRQQGRRQARPIEPRPLIKIKPPAAAPAPTKRKTRLVAGGWTDDEDCLLMQHWAQDKDKCYAELTAHSRASIQRRASHLELTQKAESSRARWSDKEDTIIKRAYPTGGTHECAKHLPGRSLKSIKLRAQRLDVQFSGATGMHYGL